MCAAGRTGGRSTRGDEQQNELSRRAGGRLWALAHEPRGQALSAAAGNAACFVLQDAYLAKRPLAAAAALRLLPPFLCRSVCPPTEGRAAPCRRLWRSTPSMQGGNERAAGVALHRGQHRQLAGRRAGSCSSPPCGCISWLPCHRCRGLERSLWREASGAAAAAGSAAAAALQALQALRLQQHSLDASEEPAATCGQRQARHGDSASPRLAAVLPRLLLGCRGLLQPLHSSSHLRRVGRAGGRLSGACALRAGGGRCQAAAAPAGCSTCGTSQEGGQKQLGIHHLALQALQLAGGGIALGSGGGQLARKRRLLLGCGARRRLQHLRLLRRRCLKLALHGLRLGQLLLQPLQSALGAGHCRLPLLRLLLCRLQPLCLLRQLSKQLRVLRLRRPQLLLHGSQAGLCLCNRPVLRAALLRCRRRGRGRRGRFLPQSCQLGTCHLQFALGLGGRLASSRLGRLPSSVQLLQLALRLCRCLLRLCRCCLLPSQLRLRCQELLSGRASLRATRRKGRRALVGWAVAQDMRSAAREQAAAQT